ncbi:hypothetical protein D3C77_605610 [compost metagenome]
MQGLQARFLFVIAKVGPVLIVERGSAGFMNDLQHGFASIPTERRAKCFMTPNHGLPGLGKALGIQGTVDPVAVLHVVNAGAGFKQGVQ